MGAHFRTVDCEDPAQSPDAGAAEVQARHKPLYWASGGLLAGIVALVALAPLVAKGAVVLSVLSVLMAYVMAPAAEVLGRLPLFRRRTGPRSRGTAIVAIYAAVLAVAVPVWMTVGQDVERELWHLTKSVPGRVQIFVQRVRDLEHWDDAQAWPYVARQLLAPSMQRVSASVQTLVDEVTIELERGRALFPWLCVVPAVTFLLLSRWPSFRQSTLRILPNAHLQWRGDEFFRHVNSVLATYTRAQV